MATIQQSGVATNSRTTAVKYPLDGWSMQLSRLPMFIQAEIDVHSSKSGKSFDAKSSNAQHSSHVHEKDKNIS